MNQHRYPPPPTFAATLALTSQRLVGLDDDGGNCEGNGSHGGLGPNGACEDWQGEWQRGEDKLE